MKPFAGAIDCDLHCVLPSIHALTPYLDDHWREYISRSDYNKGVSESVYSPNAPTTIRPDLRGGDRPAPAQSVAALRADALEATGVEIGIINCDYAVDAVHNPDASVAFCRAINDWQKAEWLDVEPRLRGSIVTPYKWPDYAAAEIDRAAALGGFTQVLVPARTEAPLGNRRYWPLFEAATRHNLPVAIQFGGFAGWPNTNAGWANSYLEECVSIASVYQSQLMSLVIEGVFDRFESLRVVCLESGWTWAPAFWWRLNKDWKGLRPEVPWVRRLPSDYIRQHVRFTLQPTDAAPTAKAMRQVLNHLESDELLLFSTDYPHWHFDTPEQALPVGLSDAEKHGIMRRNPESIYAL